MIVLSEALYNREEFIVKLESRPAGGDMQNTALSMGDDPILVLEGGDLCGQRW